MQKPDNLRKIGIQRWKTCASRIIFGVLCSDPKFVDRASEVHTHRGVWTGDRETIRQVGLQKVIYCRIGTIALCTIQGS